MSKKYSISNYTKSKASKLNLEVKPSTNKDKKLDVYKNGRKIGSVGAIGYKDYPIYLKLEAAGKVPKGTARKKRAAYKKRHEQYRKIKWSNSWLADNLLW